MQALAWGMAVTLFGFEGVDIATASQKSKLVLIAVRVHPFPSRTRKLSSLAPKILVWRRTGKIGNANIGNRTVSRLSCFLYEENHTLGEWFKRSLMAMMQTSKLPLL